MAYLDDTLEPRQAREIGQKVAESPQAGELIERIRQVMRRRRLTAPTVLGGDPDFDANIVAQYLDSSLSDEEITRVEEKCLADDQYLAEVASCHQILTLVLGEPARVPPTARERMYELVRDPSNAARRKAQLVSRRHDENHLSGGHEDADEKLLLGLPRGSNRGFMSWTPVVAGVLLVGALVALWMSIGMGGRQLTQLARNDSETPAPAPGVEARQPDPGAKPIEPGKENPVGADSGKENPAPVTTNPVPTTTPPEAPTIKPDSKPEPKPEEAPARAFPPQTARPGNKRVEMGRPGLLAGFPNLLLQRERNQPTWKRLPPEKSRVFATDQLLMLPGYRGEIRFDSGVHLVLWGSLPELAKLSIPVLESQVTINSQPGVDLDLSLERGRVLLSNHKPAGPALVRIRFGEEVWDVTLHDANSEVGLELLGTCVPYSNAPASNEPETDVALLVLKGEASFKVRNEEFLLQPSTIVTWDSVLGAASKPRQVPRLPEWYLSKNLPTSPPSAREANQLLENLSRISTTKTLDVALGECLHANEVATRVLAVRCLAALGDVSALVSALNDEKRPEMRSTAVEGLRHVLWPQLPAATNEFDRIAKEKNYTDKQIVTIRQLLQGFGGQQWAEPAVQTTVVDYLLHDKLLIRQLAYSLLVRRYPDGQRIGYDAGADLRKRERACEEWKTLVLQPQPPSPPRK